MIKQTSPRAGGQRRAKAVDARHRSGFAPSVKVDSGILFAAEVIDAERRFIRSSWLDPIECNNSGLRVCLNGRHFQDPAHSFLFCYLCLCAEHNGHPSVDEAVALVEHADLVLSAEDLWYILDPILFDPECVSLDLLAREVVANAGRIERYRRLRREADAILDRDPQTVVPKRTSIRFICRLAGRVVA